MSRLTDLIHNAKGQTLRSAGTSMPERSSALCSPSSRDSSSRRSLIPQQCRQSFPWSPGQG